MFFNKFNNSQVCVNGKTIKVPSGKNISIINGTIYVDGKKYEEDSVPENTTLVIEGKVENLSCDQSVSVNGNILGNVECKGSVHCKDIGGYVESDGSVNCGDIKGDVNSGGSVNCDSIGGSVRAKGSVNY